MCSGGPSPRSKSSNLVSMLACGSEVNWLPNQEGVKARNYKGNPIAPIMAKKRSRSKGKKMQPAITNLNFKIPAGGGVNNASDFYIDTNRALSRVNRRLYEQGRLVGYQGLTFVWRPSGSNPAAATDLATVELTVRTAGNSWIVHNAFVKGKALWNEMQDLVLDDNPSIAGKWHDFKVTLSLDMVGNQELDVLDGRGNAYLAGEWNRSTYVMPQHEVDPATGLPLPADEFTACLIGIDNPTRKSLVKAYQESRATPNSPTPNVPVGMSTSFFNLLTDSGSQEPELADVIEQENDESPYDIDEYPGGPVNGNAAVTVGFGAISSSEVDGRIGGFVAPCGLLQVEVIGRDYTGALITPANMPEIDLLLHVAPGTYKGIASIPMGQ